MIDTEREILKAAEPDRLYWMRRQQDDDDYVGTDRCWNCIQFEVVNGYSRWGWTQKAERIVEIAVSTMPDQPIYRASHCALCVWPVGLIVARPMAGGPISALAPADLLVRFLPR